MSVLRVIDTETCGLNGGVVEVASVDIDYSLSIINPMSDFVKPDRPIEFSAMAIHHITEDIVADKPLIDDVVGRYQGADFYIAHNSNFDKGVLPEMGGEWICTRKLAARLYPDLDSHTNQFLRYALGLDAWVPENLHAHRALYDCYVTAALFIRISRDSSWSVEEMLEISSQPVLLKTLRIGKHKGKTFAEVAKEDPSWLKWALSTISDMSDDMRFTIQHYLRD